jgi:hypothetical protein
MEKYIEQEDFSNVKLPFALKDRLNHIAQEQRMVASKALQLN